MQSLAHSIVYGYIFIVDVNVTEHNLLDVSTNVAVADLCWSTVDNNRVSELDDKVKVDDIFHVPLCCLIKSLRSVSSCVLMSANIISEYGLQSGARTWSDMDHKEIIEILMSAVQVIAIGNLANQVYF